MPAIRTVGDIQKRYAGGARGGHSTGSGKQSKVAPPTPAKLPATAAFPKQPAPSKSLSALERDTAFIAKKGDELKKQGSAGWSGKPMEFRAPSGLICTFGWILGNKPADGMVVLQGISQG